MHKTINCRYVCCKWLVEAMHTEAGTGAHSGSIGVDPEMSRRGVRKIMPHPPTTRMGGFQHLYVYLMPFAANRSINYCLAGAFTLIFQFFSAYTSVGALYVL